MFSDEDRLFKNSVEDCSISVANFDHRAHLRLAYIYLVNNNTEDSNQLVRQALCALLRHNNIAPSDKYHETLTAAWLLAVNHFMNITPTTQSADQFIDKNPKMLDSKIMLTHYSEALLFSDEAKNKFVEPDIDPIPSYR